MQDTYPIDINATYSVVWNTSCTRDVGDCGCDNCRGDFEDIRNRMDDFAARLEVLGWERPKTVWTVSQAFGSSECVVRISSRLEVGLISHRGAIQILVAHADGQRVSGSDYYLSQRGRERLRVLGQPDHTGHHGFRICVCKRAARTHALLIVLPTDTATRQLHARRHARSAGLGRVGVRGREDAHHGHQLE